MKSTADSRRSVTPVTRRPAQVRVIFLVGFMGAGKTSVGRALGRRLGWSFEDLDSRIESRERCSIEEIFRTRGERAFRCAENAALRELLAEGQSSPRIVALGGGAFAQRENAKLIEKAQAETVFLDAAIEELFRRCQQEKRERPLCRDAQQFRALYEQRRPYYLAATVHIETGARDIEMVAAEVACRLGIG
jgi:shikimate kinase